MPHCHIKISSFVKISNDLSITCLTISIIFVLLTRHRFFSKLQIFGTWNDNSKKLPKNLTFGFFLMKNLWIFQIQYFSFFAFLVLKVLVKKLSNGAPVTPRHYEISSEMSCTVAKTWTFLETHIPIQFSHFSKSMKFLIILITLLLETICYDSKFRLSHRENEIRYGSCGEPMGEFLMMN